jgi:GDP/UDP-N,N'-diacetylbacillosamine 2-epimerase (hydrolysing)
MNKRKICVVTGSRAEYGLLKNLINKIQIEPSLTLQIVVTGMHLSKKFGLTYKEIEEDGFKIDKKVEMLLTSNDSVSISKSTGLGLIGFSDVFNELKPDIVVLLGDRFEIFSAAIAATFAKIPIGHLHGGESTEGAFDESIRHSITKMAWWHFVSCEDYKKRVIQLGEDPKRVYDFGAIGVEAISKLELLTKNKLIAKTGIKFSKKNLMVTYHPVTLENNTSKKNMESLLSALNELNDTSIIFTMPNADTDSNIIRKLIDNFVLSHNETAFSFQSMGHLNYLSTLKYVDCVVGNSSSGLLEAPSFKIGTINIGDRQRGRLKVKSVINCNPDKASIKKSLNTIYSDRFKNRLLSVNNPYEKKRHSTKYH